MFLSDVNYRNNLVITESATFSNLPETGEWRRTSCNPSLTSNAHEFQGHTIVACFLPPHTVGSVLAEIMDNGACKGLEASLPQETFFEFKHEAKDLILSHMRALLLGCGYLRETVDFRMPHHTTEAIERALVALDPEFETHIDALIEINDLCGELGLELGNSRPEKLAEVMKISAEIRELHDNPDSSFLSDNLSRIIFKGLQNLCTEIIYYQHEMDVYEFFEKGLGVVTAAYEAKPDNACASFVAYLDQVTRDLKLVSQESIFMGTEHVRSICALGAAKAKTLFLGEVFPCEASQLQYSVDFFMDGTELKVFRDLPACSRIEILTASLPGLYTQANLKRANI